MKTQIVWTSILLLGLGSLTACDSQFQLKSDLASGLAQSVNLPSDSTPVPTITPTPSPSPTTTATVTPSPTATTSPGTSLSYLRGINIMDPGIGPHSNPGVFNTQYTTPTLEALKLLKGRGLQVIRLTIMWERMQKTLNGELDATYLGLIMQCLRDANTAGIKIILDLHNYGRYTINGVTYRFGDSGGPSQAQYADVWIRMVNAIKADSAAYNSIYAYDLMNEPYDLPTVSGVPGNKIWEQYAQAAVTGIRSTGEKMLIHVEGYFYASPIYFPTHHPVAFINDPANNLMYQAHLYLDNNSSGVYAASHTDETNLAKAQGHASVGARGIARLKIFTDWCTAQKVRCFVGEYGWPNAHTVGASDGAAWNATGEILMKYMDEQKLGATMWATGSWLNPTTNILNTYVLPGRSNNTFQALSQSAVLEAYPGK